MKKETIEEAAERLYPNDGYCDEIYSDIGEFNREKWIEGAKWNQERSYSQEEVNEIIAESWNSCEDNEGNETFTQARERILKQFKKK